MQLVLVLVLLFTVLPTVELMLLFGLWEAIGLPLTVAIALGTGVLGAWLARQQGLATLAKISRQLANREAPADSLIDGAMILVAGAVLITPGVLTDSVGFALLLPPVRAALKPLLKAAFKRRLQRAVERGNVRVWTFGPEAPGTSPRGDVIEGEVVDVRTLDGDDAPPR